MMKRPLPALTFALIGLLAASTLDAAITLPKVIGSGMVLQRESQAAVWGAADPGEAVTISCSWMEKPISVKADDEGDWSAKLKTGQAGGPHTITLTASNTITLEDVQPGVLIYGVKVACEGPRFREMVVKDGKATLHFDHVGGGLTVYGDSGLKDFEIAGADRKFVQASAVIIGNKIVVGSPGVSQPAAVRYAFSSQATGSLGNKDGLPASPFRTDDWK